ncbi:MAG: hypothetical protein WAU41_00490 [Gaiellaceae bacterium]
MLHQRETAATTWARIEARSYDDALQLLERLLDRPSTLVQFGEQEWSIYVAADAPEVPAIVSGCGVAPSRVTLIDDDAAFGAEGVAGGFDEDLRRSIRTRR